MRKEEGEGENREEKEKKKQITLTSEYWKPQDSGAVSPKFQKENTI